MEIEGNRIGALQSLQTGTEAFTVGTEMAETEVGDIRRYAAGPTAPWKAHTRISSDGGETWSEEAKSAPTE